MPVLRTRWVATLSVGAALLLAAGTAPAVADDTYTLPLHQSLPLTATSKGVENQKSCADIPATKDGWHFVLPGNSTTFVKLTVTFEPGGQQVVTVFGPPTDKHAYVASAPGAKLTAASAQVKGGSVAWFNLSHTCPASSKPSGSPSPSPSGTPSTTPSQSASQSPSQSASGTPSTTPSHSPSGSQSGTPSGTPSSAAPSVSVSPSAGTTGGDLAKTGSDTPIGLLATLAGALVAAGAFLVVRRRRVGAQG
ncbi:LPXTG cell wall anchor domain-containing protein [Streptomyces sp. NPDC006430]|uniref:LPXTG cell wall anchor domain-containing protein n=1 Tax=Streptomyces sp. NPDC006430 TaxID=3154299 RepID=UPI0033B58ECA